MISIKKTNNGFIVKTSEGESSFEFNYNKDSFVKVDKDDVYKEEHQTLGRLLHFIAEELGYNYDKYKTNNLKITFDNKGHKI